MRIRVAVLVGAFLIAGCSPSPSASETKDIADAGVPSPAVTTSKNPDLAPLIERAGLEPCPLGDDNPDAAIPGLPSVTFRCLGDGPDVNLSAVRGTPLVINVWASWCPPCIAEMPILASAAADLKGQVQFLGVDIEDRDSAALMMMEGFDADFPSVVDNKGEIRRLMAISGPPVTFFVNEFGVIVGRHNGSLPDDAYLNQLLARYLGVRR